MSNKSINPHAEAVAQLIAFLKDEQQIVQQQKDIADAIGISATALSRAKNPTERDVQLASRTKQLIMEHYQLAFHDETDDVNNVRKVHFINPPTTTPTVAENTPPPSIATVTEAPTESKPTKKQYWNQTLLQWVYPPMLLLAFIGYQKACGLESHIQRIDGQTILFNKSLSVMRDTVNVGFLGDKSNTRYGGFSLFKNEHNRRNLFVGTYYRQFPALVFYNGDKNVPTKDSETFFMGQTSQEVCFSGMFWRKRDSVGNLLEDITGSLISRNAVGNGYQHSSNAYDKKVVGILSENVGAIAGNKSSNEYIIATEGTIHLRVSIQNGHIEVGDLLTASDQEGVAMKADLQNPKSRGSIIAKALAPFQQAETGKILVLITRQ